MKKLFLIILSLLSLSCLVAVGCGDSKEIGSDVKFLHFVDGEGTTLLDYELNQYFNSDDLQNKINGISVPYYTVEGGKYSDGTQFSVEKENINAYITTHEADLTIPKKFLFMTNDCPAFTVVTELSPIEYTITYNDIDGATFNGPSTYTVESDGALAKPSKQYYHFLCWYEKGVDEGRNVQFVRENLPTAMPRDIVLYAKWEAISFDVTYAGLVEGISNPNDKKVVYQKDGSYQLTPIPSTAAYTFKGWKINGEYATKIDPMAIWDPTADISDNDAYSVTVTADLEFYDFKADFYVGDSLYESKIFNFSNFAALTIPNVPVKEHYTGRWSQTVDEFKNYKIQAIYELDSYNVGVQTNISGYTVSEQKYDYGTTYKTIYDKLSYNNKMLLGLYFDSACTERATETDYIEKGGTLYAKWLDRYSLSSVSDWSLLSERPETYFVIANDLDFQGEAIPVISDFNGVLDGQGHKIFNFINLNNNCDSTYGLFAKNSGAIRNIVFDDGIFTATTNNEIKDKNVGFLCGINKGSIENVCVSETTVKIVGVHSTEPMGVWAGNTETYLNAGIIAGNNQGTISYSTVENTVKADMNTTMYSRTAYRYDDNFIRTWASYGLIAGINSGTISSVTSSASVATTATLQEELGDYLSKYYAYTYYPLRMGGITGANNAAGIISNALSNAKVTSKFTLTSKRNYGGIVDIGGISGFNAGQIMQCIASNDCSLDAYANADTRMGGICGTSEGNGVIKSSYSRTKFTIGNANTQTEKTYLGGIVGLNCAAVSYSYAIVDNVGLNAFNGQSYQGYVNGYFGGMFGYGNELSSIVHCFGVVDADLSQSPMAYKSKQGAVVDGTVVKCFVFITANTSGLTATDDNQSTVCDTKENLIEKIQNDGYKNMGYTLNPNDYPTLLSVGHTK